MTLLLSGSSLSVPFMIPYWWETFWPPGDRWVQHCVWSSVGLHIVWFSPFSSTTRRSSSDSQNTQKKLEEAEEGFRGRTSERTHWAVMAPRMDRVLELAEMNISVHPVFTSTSRLSEPLQCSHVPHSLKSRSPSVPAEETQAQSEQIFYTVWLQSEYQLYHISTKSWVHI